MSNYPLQLPLKEYSFSSPGNTNVLKGLFLTEEDRLNAERINKSGILNITELKEGLSIRTFSHVGKIRIGELLITISPKIESLPLIKLLRYSFDLRYVNLLKDVLYSEEKNLFQELLVLQFEGEVSELLYRGLKKDYRIQYKDLIQPKGRINFNRIAINGYGITTSIPCIYFSRIENTLLNQVILGGVELAKQITSNSKLRTRLELISNLLKEYVTPVMINRKMIDSALYSINRLSESYEASVKIIQLLYEGIGIEFLDNKSINFHGFLFDMNFFYQRLISRFLTENLIGFTVLTEKKLQDMMSYMHGLNPNNRQNPNPRPDFVIKYKTKTISIIDTKYRDLWNEKLPREMLYQLTIYALSDSENQQAIILYPALDSEARDAAIEVKDPVNGISKGIIIIRPFHINKFLEILDSGNEKNMKQYAESIIKKI